MRHAPDRIRGGKFQNDLLPIAALLALGSFAFAHLMALPAFADEGGQLRWIYRVIEAGEWLQPLGDGKPLMYSSMENELTVTLPATLPGKYAYVLKVPGYASSQR